MTPVTSQVAGTHDRLPGFMRDDSARRPKSGWTRAIARALQVPCEIASSVRSRSRRSASLPTRRDGVRVRFWYGVQVGTPTYHAHGRNSSWRCKKPSLAGDRSRLHPRSRLGREVVRGVGKPVRDREGANRGGSGKACQARGATADGASVVRAPPTDSTRAWATPWKTWLAGLRQVMEPVNDRLRASRGVAGAAGGHGRAPLARPQMGPAGPGRRRPDRLGDRPAISHQALKSSLSRECRYRLSNDSIGVRHNHLENSPPPIPFDSLWVSLAILSPLTSRLSYSGLRGDWARG